MQQRHKEKQQLLVQLEKTEKSYRAEHVAQKARKEAEAKVREEAERRRVVEKEKKKKRLLKYIQQLWDKILEKDTALLEGAKRSQIVGPKHKRAPLGDNVDHWPFKKTKEKQPVRYCEDFRVKIGDANPCERYVCIRQDCLVYNSM